MIDWLGVAVVATAVTREIGRQGGQGGHSRELFGHRAIVSAQNRASRGLEQHDVRGGHLCGASQEHAAWFVRQLGRRAQSHQFLQPVAQFISRIGIVQEDEIRQQSATTPVRVRSNQFAGQVGVPWIRESGQHDREIAGDPVRPQARLAEAVSGDGFSAIGTLVR